MRAAENDVEDMRVQLIESARLAFLILLGGPCARGERGGGGGGKSLKLLKQFRERRVRYN